MVARDAVDLFAAGDPARLRRCQGRQCALVFYDDSRSGARRWCAPERCGDRTRARVYRARQAAHPGTGRPDGQHIDGAL